MNNTRLSTPKSGAFVPFNPLQPLDSIGKVRAYEPGEVDKAKRVIATLVGDDHADILEYLGI